jgi:hypothetical protein
LAQGFSLRANCQPHSRERVEAMCGFTQAMPRAFRPQGHPWRHRDNDVFQSIDLLQAGRGGRRHDRRTDVWRHLERAGGAGMERPIQKSQPRGPKTSLDASSASTGIAWFSVAPKRGRAPMNSSVVRQPEAIRFKIWNAHGNGHRDGRHLSQPTRRRSAELRPQAPAAMTLSYAEVVRNSGNTGAAISSSNKAAASS